MTTQTVAARVEPVPEWAGLIHQSVDEVFDMMLGMKVAPCASNGFRYEVTSMVGLAGALCGLLMVRCSNETAANLTCRMLGTDSVDSQDDVHDALGEICNMVAGSFKSKIPGLSDGCMLSVPTTVTGSDYQIHPLRAMPPFLELFSRGDDCPIEVLLHVTK